MRSSHVVDTPDAVTPTAGDRALEAIAFKRLREIPKGDGGTKKKMGRPKSGVKPELSEGRDEAAAMLGVSTDEARALETVFTTPGVPDELKAAVNHGFDLVLAGVSDFGSARDGFRFAFSFGPLWGFKPFAAVFSGFCPPTLPCQLALRRFTRHQLGRLHREHRVLRFGALVAGTGWRKVSAKA